MRNRVLIACPIGGMKQYSINTWFRWIAGQSYEDYDICLCCNGKHRVKLFIKLDKVRITDIHGHKKRLIRLLLPNSDNLTTIQKITYAREKIRRYAIESGYDHIFWLDSDTIPANRDAIQQLMNWNKESVSGLYYYKHSSVPVIIDKDTHTNMSQEKIVQAASDKMLLDIWGSGYGCLLHSGRAMTTAFDYALFGEERTDDFGHCHALEQEGVLRYFDPFVLCKHFDSGDNTLKINQMMGLNKRLISTEKINDIDGQDKIRTEAEDKGVDR